MANQKGVIILSMKKWADLIDQARKQFEMFKKENRSKTFRRTQQNKFVPNETTKNLTNLLDSEDFRLLIFMTTWQMNLHLS